MAIATDRPAPMQIAAILGARATVRWMSPRHMGAGTSLAEHLLSRFAAVRVPPVPVPTEGDEARLELLGLVVVRQWDFETAPAALASQTTIEGAMCQAVLHDRRRPCASVGILRYPIVAAASFSEPVLVPEIPPACRRARSGKNSLTSPAAAC